MPGSVMEPTWSSEIANAEQQSHAPGGPQPIGGRPAESFFGVK